MTRGRLQRRVLAWASVGALLAGVMGCSSTNLPKIAELPAQPAVQATAWAWHVPMAESSGVLRLQVVNQIVYAASDNGDLLAMEASTGRVIWRVRLPDGLSAGVGGDANRVAVVTLNNELLSIQSGEVRWRVRLPARVLTPPLVAGGRVFVALSDRSTMAFDGSTGARLWTQPRSGDPLVLRQAGVLLAVGDTLVSGGLGRLQGLNPVNGRVVWDAPLATPRGTNEVERLVDTVGPVSREGNSVCARAFNASVGCIDASTGRVVWTRPSQGAVGLGGDAQHVVGADSDGRLVAWRRDNGEPAWSLERFKHRGLTAPVVLNGHLAVGDEQGLVHWLNLKTAADVARWRADGSAIVGAPVTAAGMVVVQTRKGGVYAWRAP
jgi:outer membrane protein assembly factor BamB